MPTPTSTGTTAANPSVPYADMASGVNSFMAGQAQGQYLQNLPNYAGMVGQRSQNTMSELQGQLPPDVIQQIAQQAAERGISGGTPGSPNSGAAYLRALGLNSLQLTQTGSQNLGQSIADTPTAEIWNPLSLYTPQVLAQQEQSAAQAGQSQLFSQQKELAAQASQPQLKHYSRSIVPGSGSAPGFTPYDFWA